MNEFAGPRGADRPRGKALVSEPMFTGAITRKGIASGLGRPHAVLGGISIGVSQY